jgi:acetolactate synthase-1/2/3 large subunit
MVKFQEEAKYSRSLSIRLSGVDFVRFTEAFGATGFRVNDSSDLEAVMRAAWAVDDVSIVDFQIDYSNSIALMINAIPNDFR